MKREEALDVALGQIERQFGKGSVMRMSDRPQVAVGAISTGSLALDMALGIGGLPRGRIVEIFGPESSGKTTLVYHVMAEAQRRGGICAFTDAEHAIDPSYARAHWNTAVCNLLLGDYAQGWRGFEWRVPAGEVALDRYEQPRPQLDFIYSQRLRQNWKLTFKARNLLDSDVEVTQGPETHIRFDLGRDYTLALEWSY